MKVRPGLLAVLLGSLVSAAAAAVAMASSNGGPVVLLGTAEDEPLTGRIAAELRALGIPIEIRVVSGEEPGIDLEVDEALREGARAAVRVDALAGRTEVSIADPTTHRVALKQVLEGPPTTALAPVLAVRTVEFVRATLLGPHDDDTRRAQGERAARRDAVAPDAEIAGSPAKESEGNAANNAPLPATSRLRVALSSGVLLTPDGLDPQGALALTARVRVLGDVGVEAMGVLPLNNGRIDGTLGSSQSSTRLAALGLLARRPLSSRAGVEGAAGVMFADLRTNGKPATPSTTTPAAVIPPGRVSETWGESIYGRVGADVALTSYLSLRLDVLSGVAVKEAFVVIDGHDRPAWSRAFVATLGGVEARWF